LITIGFAESAMPLPQVKTVNVHELRQLLAQPAPPLLLDVREADEWRFCRIDGAVHLPMSQIARRVGELDPAWPMIVYCHHGIRSHRVAEFLLHQGFADVANLAGGIDAWSVQVDPSVPRY
jgi:rhodanese-related sulfurtransferase